jgi:hypothetical protein
MQKKNKINLLNFTFLFYEGEIKAIALAALVILLFPLSLFHCPTMSPCLSQYLCMIELTLLSHIRVISKVRKTHH